MSEKLFKKLDYIFGWVLFFIAAIVYLLTIEQTVSFWDCGEFISSANKLEVGHPPGAPFFMLLTRLFAMFASGPESVAIMVNAFSAIVSAFAIMFLYWTIAYFARRMVVRDNEYNWANTIAVIGASLVGALVYTFSDTFWFSAVEGEVYGFSSFFTAIVFWSIIKWSDSKDEQTSLRWILLISLLTGMSIGVHLLNLLTIPAIAFVIYYKNFKPNVFGFILTAITSLFVIAVLMWGIIPGVAIVASKFELLMVNKMGLPYNTGLVFWLALTLLCLALSIYLTQYSKNKILNYIVPSLALILVGAPFFTSSGFFNFIFVLLFVAAVVFLTRKQKKMLNLLMLCVTLVIIGYSSYAIIVIRSNANTPMNQNSPDDVFSLLYYLNREQYGDRPLMYGQYYTAGRPTDQTDSSPIYVKRNDRYEIVNYKSKTKYDSSHCTLFPRMFSSDPDHIDLYKAYGGIRPNQKKPTFANNLKFFINYQMNHMYWRYFMWNFAGRQNDIQSRDNILHGNWISGLSFIDNPRVGDQDKMPDYLKNNKANNRYYMLPLMLGLLGLGYQLFKNVQDWWIVSLFFILTGIAIVVYLNQTPNQPRERDYAYAGSFYAFSIWIGLGVVAIYGFFKKYNKGAFTAIFATLICLPVPIIMASENWDDHDRSNRYIARDFAHNYLESCAPNAILFTHGDNDTFPIWYAQEVEGIRTDVKVCCLPYFASDWYIDQMKCKTYEAEPLPLSFDRSKYEPSVRDVIYHMPAIFQDVKKEDNTYISVDSLINFIKNDKLSKIDKDLYVYNKNKLFLRVDSAKVVRNGTVRPEDAHLISKVIKFDLDRYYIVKNEMMILDMLNQNNWDRPVYMTSVGATPNAVGLNSYFQNEGFSYRLVPIESDLNSRVNSDILYENLMERFKWGNMNDPNILIDNTIGRTVRVVKIRDTFKDLVIKLAEEEKFDKAKKVIKRCEELMPPSIYNIGVFDLEFANAYYAIGDIEGGDNFIREAVRIVSQEMDFFASLDRNQRIRSAADINLSMYTYQKALQILMFNNRENIKNELYAQFERYSALI